jgi:biopolymer transport protein TolQ
VAVDHSLLSFFTGASLVVKLVMLILLAASIVSWTLIFQRSGFINRAKKGISDFEQRFWSGEDLNKLYTYLSDGKVIPEGMSQIFVAGFKEFLRLRQQTQAQPAVIMEGVQRTMRVAHSRELDKLENHLSFLATVGSTSPYVGLFGTVWGIMTSFQALGNASQATVAMVAPGISEALIATAMGLFAAIPAVVAYNRFANRVERIANQYDDFLEEFTNILSRQLHTNGEKI